MNQQQRKYLIERVTEEQQRKARGLNQYNYGPFWNVSNKELKEIGEEISYLLKDKFPQLGDISLSVDNKDTDTSYRGHITFLVGPTSPEKSLLRTNHDNIKKIEQIRQEAKKVSDTIMLGEETEALKMLQDFMKMEF